MSETFALILFYNKGSNWSDEGLFGLITSVIKTVSHPLIISIRLSRLKPCGFRVTNQNEL